MTHPSQDADFENFTTVASLTTSDMLDNVTFVEVFMEHLALTLNVYYTPVLIVLGSLGNILSIVVFFNSKQRMQSTSQYLTALALSDTLFLCQLLPPWLKAVGASTLFAREGFCQGFVYMSYVTCNLSSWLVVAFTIERFVAVVYPLKRNAMCTVKRARYIIASLAATTLLINLPVLRFAVPKGNDCNIDEPLMAHAARFNLVDTAVAFTLPLAVIVVLNAWIMWGVYRLGRTRRHLMRQQRPFRARGPASLNQTHDQRPSATIGRSHRAQQRVTRMLLIVSSVFVVLNLPAYTMRIVAYTNNMDEREYSGMWAAVQQVCLLFFNTNFGINFVLYCMTGQNFREALKEIFPFLRKNKLTRIALRAMNREPAPRASSVSTHSFSTNHTEATTAGNNAASNSAARYGCQPVAGPSREHRACGGAIRRHATGRVDHPPPKRRRRRREGEVIQRWRFDNSRQLRQYSVEPEPDPDNRNM